MAGTSRTLKLKILGDVDSLNKSLGKSQTSIQKFGEFSKKAFAAIAVAASAMAVKIGTDAVRAASDLNEVLSKTNVLFAESSDEITKWADSSATAFGQSKRQALDAASQFAIFGQAAGLTGDSLVKFSTGFTELASDLASFNNTSPEQAITAIGAALRGESEPIRNYGVLLNEATLKQKALELGIISTTSEALTPQQKVLAAQAAIYEQTTAAQGDFARTSDQLANSQRILAANFEDASAKLGEKLLPIMTSIVQWVNEKAIPAFEQFSAWFNENITPALEDFAKWWDEYITPAIQLFVKWVQERLIPAFKQMVGYIKEDAQPVFDRIRQTWEDYKPQIKAVLGLLGAIADWVITVGIPVLVVGFFQAIGILIDTANAALKSMLSFLELIGVGVYETAKTTTKELKNMESGFSEMSDVQNAKIAASKSGLLGYQKETKTTAATAVDSFAAIGAAAGGAADKQSKAADKVKKANDKMQAAWVASMKAAKEAAKAAIEATWNVLQSITSAIADLRQKAADYGRKFSDVIVGILSLSDAAAEAGDETGKTFMQSLLDQVAKAQMFAAKIKALIKAGLSQAGIDQILSAGADTGSRIADEILSTGSVGAVNALFDQMSQTASDLADYASGSVYGSEIKKAEFAAADARIAAALAGTLNVGGMAGWEAILASGSPEMQASVAPGTIPPYINITVNGALDPEAVARQINGILQTSANRTGNYTNLGVGNLSLAGV